MCLSVCQLSSPKNERVKLSFDRTPPYFVRPKKYEVCQKFSRGVGDVMVWVCSSNTRPCSDRPHPHSVWEGPAVCRMNAVRWNQWG